MISLETWKDLAKLDTLLIQLHPEQGTCFPFPIARGVSAVPLKLALDISDTCISGPLVRGSSTAVHF